MRLETAIELEDTIRKEYKDRFPSLDANWAVNRYMDKIHENSKKNAEVLIGMIPEIVRSQRIKRSQHDEGTK